MRRYPSAETVPPKIHECVLLALWLTVSSLVIGVYGWHAIAHALPLAPVLILIGAGLLFCLPFGVAGLFFRTRRRTRLARRKAFLAELSE